MGDRSKNECSDDLRMLRMPEVVRKVGLCRSEISDRVRKGEFPRPVPLGKRAVGFPEHEINGYLADLIASARKGEGI
ncbi:AlpA family phage regulatory protein [Ramlibacter sp.]|uniref:helix-turn-helix transcriptional regulator n=1 Tax=Ramlibacter sp. TaxID=1917967 RepID=UPI0026209E56|nr:AlpA family phage regulatory protein [Ramlibacter sp.]MDB5956735.1 prophage regulatory family protein [Ramlibacter sp.]